MISITLQAEKIFSIAGIHISNSFFTSILITLFLLILVIFFYTHKNKNKLFFIKSTKILIYKLLQLTDSITKNRKLSKTILPLIATLFIFIVSSNVLALIPGFLGSFFIQEGNKAIPLLRSPNSDLTITLALAIISVISIQYYSLKALGFLKYMQRFINFQNPITFTLGIFELISELVKILSFSFRLFGNVFAGEILLLIISMLVPYLIPLPFMFLELFIGIIQAFIFSILTLSFIQTSSFSETNINN